MDFEDSPSKCFVCFGILQHYVLAQPQKIRGGDFLLCAWPGHLGIAGAALATSFATWWVVIVACMLPMGCKMGNTCQGSFDVIQLVSACYIRC